MSERVCYIRRADRGAALRALRIIGAHADDSWQSSPSEDPVLVAESIREGARWIRARLGSNGSRTRVLAVLCLDPDGAVCSWVKPEDADGSLLEATLSTEGSDADPDTLEEHTPSGIGERFPKLPLELSFELLDPDETSTGSRAAVMALPDVPGRLLKDALDAMGIRIDCFTTIWHALAHVWDPANAHAQTSAERIVSSDAPIAATIAIDHDDGRLIWTWSRAGKLIAAGTSRITSIPGEHASTALIREQDIARTCSDWLGWSSQLGVCPSRITVIGCPGRLETSPDETPGSTHDSKNVSPHRGLGPAEIGRALSRAWPEATIDLVELDDPIAETLRRVAMMDTGQGDSGQIGQGLVSLVGLSTRPTRTHRSMHRWIAMAMVMVSGLVGLLAYQLLAQAETIKHDTDALRSKRITLINDFDPELVRSPLPTRDLQIKLEQLRLNRGPVAVARSKPILEELETISYVFGIPGIEVDSISLNNITVTVKLSVEDIAQAEQINQSLGSIMGSHLRWGTMTPANRGQKIQATFSARWKEPGGGS